MRRLLILTVAFTVAWLLPVPPPATGQVFSGDTDRQTYCYGKISGDASQFSITYHHPLTGEGHKHWYRVATHVRYDFCFRTNRDRWFAPKRGSGHVTALHRTTGCSDGPSRGSCAWDNHPRPGRVDCDKLQGVRHELRMADTHDGNTIKHSRGPWTWTDGCRPGHDFGSSGRMNRRPHLHPYPRFTGTAGWVDTVTFKRRFSFDSEHVNGGKLNSRIFA